MKVRLNPDKLPAIRFLNYNWKEVIRFVNEHANRSYCYVKGSRMTVHEDVIELFSHGENRDVRYGDYLVASKGCILVVQDESEKAFIEQIVLEDE